MLQGMQNTSIDCSYCNRDVVAHNYFKRATKLRFYNDVQSEEVNKI